MITFLSAKLPLTKTIAYDGKGRYTVTPYPLVKEVSSHVEDVKGISQLYTALKSHSDQNHCLLKGNLDKVLVHESRANHTLDNVHDWLVFDFDKVDCEPSHDGVRAAIIKYLPKEFHDVSYVSQLSASCFIPTVNKLSAHVYMWLDEPVSTQQLTAMFTSINWNGKLKDELELSDSGITLRWALDRTVAHSSKLIYIAAPKCVGFDPKIKTHIQYEKGKRASLKLPFFKEVQQDEIRAHINLLRSKASLPEIQHTFVNYRGKQVLANSPKGVIHDVRRSGNGYIRFNMNGGDSLAYFINLREPHIIGNHKGEPYMYTEQIDEAFYKSLIKASKAAPVKSLPITVEPLAFYATNRQSTVYIGIYDRENDELKLNPSTETAAKAWMIQHGYMLTMLPHYDLVVDITSDIRYERGFPVINMYKRTDYIKEYADLAKINDPEHTAKDVKQHCPVIWKTLCSALGAEEAVVSFLNWLAFVFQERRVSGTAWVLHGVEGTGKGMIFHHIAQPLFGENFVTMQQFNLAKTNFNAYLEGKLLVAFDEADIGYETRDELMAKLKNWITEPKIVINDKGKTERTVKNFANFLFFSNSTRPIVVESHDRRFNVAEYQKVRLLYRPNEYAKLQSGEELPALAKALGQLRVDEEMLLIPFAGEAKARMYDATHSMIDQVARAIHAGDTLFFIEARPSDTQLKGELLNRQLPIGEYDRLVRLMMDNELNVLTKNDLYVLFRTVIANDKLFPSTNAEQKRIYSRTNLVPNSMVRDKRTGKPTRGYAMSVDWQKVNETPDFLLKESKITAIK